MEGSTVHEPMYTGYGFNWQYSTRLTSHAVLQSRPHPPYHYFMYSTSLCALTNTCNITCEQHISIHEAEHTLLLLHALSIESSFDQLNYFGNMLRTSMVRHFILPFVIRCTILYKCICLLSYLQYMENMVRAKSVLQLYHSTLQKRFNNLYYSMQACW